MMDILPNGAGGIFAFFRNPLFTAACTSWLLAQVVKAAVTIGSLKTPRLQTVVEALFWRTGGMPSSHAATVSALSATAAAQEGFGSNLFVVTFFFSLVVLRDAVGVRRSSGLQARLLNTVAQKLAARTGEDYPPVKEIQGHTPLEVLAGLALGIAVASAYAFV